MAQRLGRRTLNHNSAGSSPAAAMSSYQNEVQWSLRDSYTISILLNIWLNVVYAPRGVEVHVGIKQVEVRATMRSATSKIKS